MSFHKRSGIHSKKHAMKRRKKLFALLSLLIGCIIVALTSTIYVLRSPLLQINDLSVEGTTVISPLAVRTAALNTLQGSYLGMIPFTNILFFPKNNLEKTLKDSFPEIDTLSISRN